MVPVYVIHAILLHVTLFMIILKQHVMKSDKKKLQVYTRLTAQDLHVYIYNNQQCDILLVFSRFHYHNHGHRSKYSLFSSECFLQTTK